MITFDVRHYDSIGSTNDEALRLAGAGAPHGTVVCAREQTAGRGRQARHWHSPAGNLYVSIVLRPDTPPSRAGELSFVTALAVADAVDAFLPESVRAALKWPNDVLVQGAKIAGILLETADAVVVAGIGINVVRTPSDAPYKVTSLADSGGRVLDAEATLHALLEALARRLTEWLNGGFMATRTAWLERAHPCGTPLRISVGDRAIAGEFAGLAHDGTLLVATSGGEVRIVAGDVVLPREI